ncbi:LLM class flavin-dependent oxidoreductase [Schumannella soli]|uniref:LLM class flavin-dependent oxidoreductase n=1 Tax=Schumannella soli TaxID=2590779 RepID=A0A506Y3Y8_9MICO|nr:LLM class flavin-dependent oxidoreductase [Schumannella soli]TPW75718.1 LLM class flavin-dependent oxidoreductase [Schumannella soli]
MTSDRPSLQALHFLTPGNFDDDRPREGLEATLRLFEFGESLGLDGAWIRQRHLEHGVSSAAVFLAAAGQRTRRIQLGTAVIPLGYETPFRLAEDLAVADVLSGGRLQIGVSAGLPPHAELIGDEVFEGDWRSWDFSHGRAERLIHHLSGAFFGDADTVIHSPGNVQRPRVQPFSPGLADRVWYGGGSLASIEWAARAGRSILIGNVISGEGTDDFISAQTALLARYRTTLAAAAEEGVVDAPTAASRRVALGRVIVPIDGADRAARERYRDYARARLPRLGRGHGPKNTLFAPDLVGSAEEIVARLLADPLLAQVDELRLELPYEFSQDDYEQILADVVGLVAPRLGWNSRVAAADPSFDARVVAAN